MGKRSAFPRRPHDAYQTPLAPVLALLPHLPRGFTFCEPCAGEGHLIRHLEVVFGARCTAAYDITSPGMRRLDARRLIPRHLRGADLIITNPPWSRDLLHPLIERFSSLAPTWLLFDADWIHTGQSRPHRRHLASVVSVGRVEWIEGSGATGKDNAAWHLFDPVAAQHGCIFHGREEAA